MTRTQDDPSRVEGQRRRVPSGLRLRPSES